MIFERFRFDPGNAPAACSTAGPDVCYFGLDGDTDFTGKVYNSLNWKGIEFQVAI